MKAKIILLLFILKFNLLFCQINDFKIGMFGNYFTTVNGVPWSGLKQPSPNNAYNSSSLNVLSSDGFNITTSYKPDYVWVPSNSYEMNYLTLVQNNSMQELTCIRGFYKPDLGSHQICDDTDPFGPYIFPPSGTNIYNWNGQARPNYDDLFNSVFNISPYSSIVWGHQISEEASFRHHYNPTDNGPEKYPNEFPCDHFNCDQYQNNCWIPDNYLVCEVPPSNINLALSYFKNKNPNQKLIVMEANHGKSINANTNDGLGTYNPQEYINQINRPDVFF